ncbi:ankyrin repeat-containing domain protein, partial [Podospora australis]
ALHTAEGSSNIVSVLLGYGADSKVVDASGVTVFHRGKLSPEAATLLIEAGGDLKAEDHHGRTATWYASGEYLDFLLKSGLDINHADSDVDTRLHKSVYQSDCEELLRKGALADATDRHGRTPIMLCARSGNTEIAEVLLAFGADPNAVCLEGKNSLHHFCASIDDDEEEDGDGDSNDSEESYDRNTDDQLEDDDADDNDDDDSLVCKDDRDDQYDLGEALDMAEILIQHDVDVNAIDEHGITPLHCVCLLPQDPRLKPLMSRLISAGADPNIPNRNGQTAVQIIQKSVKDEGRRSAFLKVLLSAG